MKNKHNLNLLPVMAFGMTLAAAIWTLALPSAAKPAAKPAPSGAGKKRDETAKAAFLAAAPVFTHPRCLNCHASGDFPRQGDDSRVHAQNVRRGSDGRGVLTQKCATCHMSHNLPEAHLPPGAANWKLPPAATPMDWEHKSPGDICRQLKSSAQNGHRTPAQVVQHVQTNALVKWGWDPGPGRTPVPGTQADFAKNIAAWAAAGGACPE
jgi:cytochrome c5